MILDFRGVFLMRTKLIETFWNAVYGLGVVTLSLTPRTQKKASLRRPSSTLQIEGFRVQVSGI